jgi:hypothetical protein
MASMTKAQAEVMAAAEAHGFIAQQVVSTFSRSPDLFAGRDGRVRGPGFRWATVNALVEAGLLTWVSRRCGRNGRWVAALSRVVGVCA